MTKRSIPPIEERRISLRLIEESDLQMTLGWRNKDNIRKWFINSNIISQEHHSEWFEKYLQLDNDYVFIIEETQDLKKAVGQISLYNIDWDRKCGEFGRMMIGEEEAQGKGIANEATGLLLRYAFAVLGLREVELVVKNDNKTAIAFYRELGFNEASDSNGLKKMILVKTRDDCGSLGNLTKGT